MTYNLICSPGTRGMRSLWLSGKQCVPPKIPLIFDTDKRCNISPTCIEVADGWSTDGQTHKQKKKTQNKGSTYAHTPLPPPIMGCGQWWPQKSRKIEAFSLDLSRCSQNLVLNKMKGRKKTLSTSWVDESLTTWSHTSVIREAVRQS